MSKRKREDAGAVPAALAKIFKSDQDVPTKLVEASKLWDQETKPDGSFFDVLKTLVDELDAGLDEVGRAAPAGGSSRPPDRLTDRST